MREGARGEVPVPDLVCPRASRRVYTGGMWGEYKVELLNPKVLPWDLLRLAAVFSSGEVAVRKAASTHFCNLAEHLHFLDELDFSQTLAEWENWQDLIKRRLGRLRLEPGGQHIDRVRFLAGQLERYITTYDLLNDRFFSLAALGFFASRLNRRQLMEILDGQSWATKHEILARWGWIRKHQELLQEGHSLLAPYSCAVTLKGEVGRQTDEEFYYLLIFLHFLRASHGEELLFAQKGETPDFTLENEKGEPVGVEMTDVWISDEWAEEQDAEDTTLKYIHNQLKHHLVRINVQKPRSWRALASRRSEVGEWLSSELCRFGTVQTKVQLESKDLDLVINLTPDARPPTGISCSSNFPRGSSEIDKNSRDLHASLRTGIGRKIAKKGKERDKPSVRPCHLVVCPHHRLDANLEAVVQEFFQNSSIGVSSHFDKVWLCDPTRLVPLN